VISGSLLGGHSHHHPHHGEHHEHAHDHSHGIKEVHEGHDVGMHDHGHDDSHHMMEEMMMQHGKVWKYCSRHFQTKLNLQTIFGCLLFLPIIMGKKAVHWTELLESYVH
jgi:hypothetical protein